MNKSLRSESLQKLPPYLFVEIDKKKRAKIAAGADVINLGVGDPDRPTMPFIVEAMARAIHNSRYHQYPSVVGNIAFRKSAARFMKKRFGVEADPETQILTVVGSKEGIFHLPLATVNPGETIIIPDPGYPVYNAGATFARADICKIPLTEQNNWLPDLASLPAETVNNARLMWANYPGNPTAAVAPLSFYQEWAEFCRANDIIAASDNAYSEVYFDEPQPSLWQADSADINTMYGIEFHSCSKTFNMTGWRVGFAVGHAEVISALASVKGNADSGAFEAVQEAAKTAFDNYDHPQVREMVEVYRRRRDIFCEGLQKLGWDVPKPAASFFVWGKCPGNMDSWEFANRCLEEADIVLVPGAGLSEHTRGYFRAAMTVEEEKMREAVQRLASIKW
ncbi:MAG TPA: aminotransferase class I/II-fold pyridoxal phosphate-dependent enzyme [Phycisphaeraceae bacterium]|nr:aminotransferase class I/II-fold pyridoxal phosphate-dependent enzyme [Phycisphaeraceae bacterium]